MGARTCSVPRRCNIANTCEVVATCNIPNTCEIPATCERVKSREQRVTILDFDHGTVRATVEVRIGNAGLGRFSVCELRLSRASELVRIPTTR